jgi:two-component system, sensor histidine kinase SagS
LAHAETVQKKRVLVLTGKHVTGSCPAVATLRPDFEVTEVGSFEAAVEALKSEDFAGVFSDSGDFLPLERAVVTQQASIVLNTIGEGVAIVDHEGRLNWSNQKMQMWAPAVREHVRRTCQEAFDMFKQQGADAATFRSRRYSVNLDSVALELVVSPVISNGGRVLQLVCVVWDVTGTRRLQSKIDAIDRAGRELVRLESDSLKTLNVGERLKLVEEKIIKSTRELMHFDHFAIRLLNRKTKQLDLVMSAGLPADALNVQLFAGTEGNGISGYVAATGQSYICVDVTTDSRYVMGLERAMSSLTVPLMLNDKVIGIFNVESVQRGAFSEDDRQFAEIFGRYVAMALNILDLLVTERIETSFKVADAVNVELAGPLNDMELDVRNLVEEYVHEPEMQGKLEGILNNLLFVRQQLRQTAEGSNTTVLGTKGINPKDTDPILRDGRVLIADDEKNIRDTLGDILRKFGMSVTTVCDGAQAIAKLQDPSQPLFDVVITDINMPGKTGYDVFDAASRQQRPPKVIMMTGFGYDPGHCAMRANQQGLSGMLFKPFKVVLLIDEVRKAMQSHQQPFTLPGSVAERQNTDDHAPGS